MRIILSVCGLKTGVIGSDGSDPFKGRAKTNARRNKQESRKFEMEQAKRLRRRYVKCSK